MSLKIYGIGVDIIKNSRMERVLNASYSQRFMTKVLHPSEIEDLQNKKSFQSKVIYLASRWSYKEACVKASGRTDLNFPSMYLVKDENGKPFIKFSGINEQIIEEELGIKRTHLSISHEDDMSISYVIMEH